MKLSRQEERIYSFMRNHGYINPLQAWEMCGVYRLSAVIHQLKAKGVEIHTKRVHMLNRFNEQIKFAEYQWIQP